jgi:hypothetical protein
MKRGKIAEAQEILGLSRRHIEDMAARGDIPGAAKYGNRWTFDLQRLRKFVEDEEKRLWLQSVARPRRGAIGDKAFSTGELVSMVASSGGRSKQMIQRLRQRVAKQEKMAS